MKKIKLVLPILTLSALGTAVLPLTSCKNGNDDPKDQCTITFIARHGKLVGRSTITVKSGTKFGDIPNKPIIQPDSGYYFNSWDFNDEGEILIDRDIEPNIGLKKTIYFSADDFGKIEGSDTLNFGEGAKWKNIKSRAPDVEATIGDEFKGWYYKDTWDMVSDDDIIEGGKTIQARFTTPYDDSDKFFGYDSDQHKWCWYEKLAEGSSIICHYEGGQQVTIYRYNFNAKIYFGNQIHSLPDNFLKDCTTYDKDIIIPDSITTIGDNFLMNIKSDVDGEGNGEFNSLMILPKTLTSIGEHFMHGCLKFNRPLSLPDSLNSVGDGFLRCCGDLVSTININNLNPNIFQATLGAVTLCSYHPHDSFNMGIPIKGANANGFIVRFSKVERYDLHRYRYLKLESTNE